MARCAAAVRDTRPSFAISPSASAVSEIPRFAQRQSQTRPWRPAPWFDGFRETIVVRGLEAVVRPVTEAHTWLLTIGWRRHGLLSVAERPA
jgi:hypothetical protein